MSRRAQVSARRRAEGRVGVGVSPGSADLLLCEAEVCDGNTEVLGQEAAVDRLRHVVARSQVRREERDDLIVDPDLDLEERLRQ